MELLGKSREELREWLAGLGEPAYRGDQIIAPCIRNGILSCADDGAAGGAARAAGWKSDDYVADGAAEIFFEGWVGEVFVWIGNARNNAKTQRGAEKKAASVEAVWMPSEHRRRSVFRRRRDARWIASFA